MQIPTQPNVQCPDVPGELSINGQRKDQICLENLEEYPDSAHESHNIECFGITGQVENILIFIPMKSFIVIVMFWTEFFPHLDLHIFTYFHLNLHI